MSEDNQKPEEQQVPVTEVPAEQLADALPAEGSEERTPLPPPDLPATSGVEEPVAEEVTQEVQEETVPVVPSYPTQEITDNPRVEQKFDITKAGTFNDGTKPLKNDVESMLLPSTRKSIHDHNAKHPLVDREESERDLAWDAMRRQGEMVRPDRDVFGATVERATAHFLQYLETQNGNVGFSSPKFAESGAAKLTGENAMVRMRALLGAGGLVTIPLWHSGFHITIKTPKDSVLLELRERNEQARIKLGRMTFGLIFSNTSGYLAENVVDMILNHMQSTTLQNQENIRSKISVLDLPVLVWGMACAIWPNGFQYVRALMSQEGIENKQFVSGMIDVGKLMWVDQNAFTPAQKAHMSNRQAGQITDDMLKLYRAGFENNAGRTVKLNDEGTVALKFKTPSLEDYFRSAHIWIDSLEGILNRTFTGDRTDLEARNNSIHNHANLSRMRQYGHWIESVNIEDGVFNTEDDINSALEILSDLDEAKKTYFDSVDKFINDSTAAVIAIPETSGKETNLPRFPHLIQIDAVSTFFTLLMRRLSRVVPVQQDQE